MKITHERLEKIIQEEIDRILEDDTGDTGGDTAAPNETDIFEKMKTFGYSPSVMRWGDKDRYVSHSFRGTPYGAGIEIPDNATQAINQLELFLGDLVDRNPSNPGKEFLGDGAEVKLRRDPTRDNRGKIRDLKGQLDRGEIDQETFEEKRDGVLETLPWMLVVTES